jgi:hypothetical protein
MRFPIAFALCLSIAAPACRSTGGPRVVDADPAKRAELLGALTALEGRWQVQGPAGEAPSYVEFKTTAAGSAVREVMFPGTQHEMTNMYTLDGNSALMTHYCAGGNQPHMRARALDADRLVFESDGVSDLKSESEPYMGAMTLVFVSPNQIEQHWTAYNRGAVDHNAVFVLERVH